MADVEARQPMASVSLLLSQRDGNAPLQPLSEPLTVAVEGQAEGGEVNVETAFDIDGSRWQSNSTGFSHKRSVSLDPTNPFSTTHDVETSLNQSHSSLPPSPQRKTAASSSSSQSSPRQARRTLRRQSFSLGHVIAEVPSHDLAEDPSMPRTHESRNWFMGCMGLSAAGRLLLQKAGDGQFILCVDVAQSSKLILCVRWRDSILNFSVRWSSSKHAFLFEDRADFKSIEQLISFYKGAVIACVDGESVSLTSGFAAKGLPRPGDIAMTVARLHLVSRNSNQARALSTCDAEGNQGSELDFQAMQQILREAK